MHVYIYVYIYVCMYMYIYRQSTLSVDHDGGAQRCASTDMSEYLPQAEVVPAAPVRALSEGEARTAVNSMAACAARALRP